VVVVVVVVVVICDIEYLTARHSTPHHCVHSLECRRFFLCFDDLGKEGEESRFSFPFFDLSAQRHLQGHPSSVRSMNSASLRPTPTAAPSHSLHRRWAHGGALDSVQHQRKMPLSPLLLRPAQCHLAWPSLFVRAPLQPRILTR
jgi:hypothetical protein